MTNNLLDLMPRVLTNDGHTFLPGEYDIEMCDDTPIIIARRWRYLDSESRLDRQSPFDDKNGKRVFENDMGLFWEMSVKIVFGNGAWRIISEGGQGYLLSADDNIEITGTVTWEEKG